MRFWKPKHFDRRPKVGVGVATYQDSKSDARRWHTLLSLLHALRAQTYPDWVCAVVQDGPWPESPPGGRRLCGDLADAVPDSRVRFYDTPDRLRAHGHPWRQSTVELLAAEGCEWLTLTNDDNWYAPVYLEWLTFTAVNTPDCDFVYCDLVHSHQLWKPVATQPRYRHLDLGAFLVRTELARKVPFDKFEFNGDGDWIDRLVARARAVNKVPATLMVHN
jgi:hypothetical protein